MHTVFLTGATGLLGHYTLAALLKQENMRLRVLVSPPMEASRARLIQLLADIGVDLAVELHSGRISLIHGRIPERFDPSILTGVDTILHNAGSTRFRSNASGEPLRTNVDGTVALLEDAGRSAVKNFIFVSTAYVGGLSSGVLEERLVHSCSSNANDYERSKWLAERAVFNWASHGRRGIIVRPSILIGDLAEGRSTNFGGVYVLARAVELLSRAAEQDSTLDRQQIPLRIMGRHDGPLNVTPVCWAARHLAAIACDAVNVPDIINLVNPAPPSAGEIKRWLEESFDLAGGRFTDQIWPWPNASSCEDAFYQAGDGMQAYFQRDLAFDTNYLAARGETAPLVDAAHFKKCIAFARACRWGRRSPAPVRELPVMKNGVDPVWYFEKFMTSRLPQSSIARISGLSAIVRYIIEDMADGEWVCRFQAGRMIEMHRGPNSLLENFGFRVGREVFGRIVTGKQSIQSAYFQSEAEIFGDTLMAMKMVPIMDSFLHECPLPN